MGLHLFRGDGAAGTYIFGKTESQPGAVLPNGKSKRMTVQRNGGLKRLITIQRT
jgi:hypothetical protein